MRGLKDTEGVYAENFKLTKVEKIGPKNLHMHFYSYIYLQVLD